MKGFIASVIIGFPVRGEWMAPNTPEKKIPSHGTDQLGERYAFDFYRLIGQEQGGLSIIHQFKPTSMLRHLNIGV